MATHWIIFIILSCMAFLLGLVFRRAEIRQTDNETRVGGFNLIVSVVTFFYIIFCLIWGGFFWW